MILDNAEMGIFIENAVKEAVINEQIQSGKLIADLETTIENLRGELTGVRFELSEALGNVTPKCSCQKISGDDIDCPIHGKEPARSE